MKRLCRRSISILIGLVLGWMVAGMMMGESVSLAEEGHHVEHAADSDADTGHGHDDHADHHESAHDGHENDLAAQAAASLVPKETDIAWYGTVLVLAGGLFLAAILLGYPVMKLSGPEPPDPAADHGHDDHGH